MESITVPRRHSSCSMGTTTTPPKSPTLLIQRASPLPENGGGATTVCNTIFEGSNQRVSCYSIYFNCCKNINNFLFESTNYKYHDIFLKESPKQLRYQLRDQRVVEQDLVLTVQAQERRYQELFHQS